jgi:hypothetical protein
VFRRAERAIDAYAGEWTAAAVEAARATRVRGEQTESALVTHRVSISASRSCAISQLLANADQAPSGADGRRARAGELRERSALRAATSTDRAPAQDRRDARARHPKAGCCRPLLPSMSPVRANACRRDGYEPTRPRRCWCRRHAGRRETSRRRRP